MAQHGAHICISLCDRPIVENIVNLFGHFHLVIEIIDMYFVDVV